MQTIDLNLEHTYDLNAWYEKRLKFIYKKKYKEKEIKTDRDGKITI